MAKEVIINLRIDTTDGEMSIKSLEKGFETSLITMRDLEEASRALTEALKDTRFGTEQYEQLESQLLKVDKALADQKKSLQVLNYQQVGTEVNRVVGGLTRMAGGLVLVGVSGESIEKIAKTFAVVEGASRMVTGGLAAYNGIMKLSNNITLLLTSAQTALTAAQAAGGKSAKVAAVGVRVLNAAMKANPVFLVIGGITALIGALALFSMRSEEAASANDKMNLSLDNTNRVEGVLAKNREANNRLELHGIRQVVKSMDDNIKAAKRRIATYKDLVKQGKDEFIPQLKSEERLLGMLTEARGDYKNQELEFIRDETLDDNKKRAEELIKILELVESAVDETSMKSIGKNYFDLVKLKKGSDRLNKFKALISADLNKIKDDLNATNEAFAKNKDFTQYQNNLDILAKGAAVILTNFNNITEEFGITNSETWDKTIKDIESVGTKLAELNSSNVDYMIQYDEMDNSFINEMLQVEMDDFDSMIEDLAKKEKERQDAASRVMERRKQLLDEILSKLEREKRAISDLASEKAKFANDEIKLLEISYGEERQKIIDVAIAREKAAAQESYINGKISKEALIAELENIENNHNNYLLESEKTLLAELNAIKDQSIADVKERKQRELQASIEGEQAIRSQMALEQLRFEKEMEIATLSALKETEENILEVKREYAEKEKGLITQNLSEQLDVRRLEYEADIAAKDITAEKKKLIEAKYLSDIQKMNNDAAREIQKVNSDVSVASQELTMQQLSDLTGKIASTIQEATSALSDFLQNSADAESAKLKTKNDKDAEAFKTSLANKEISEEKYQNKMDELNQKKEQQELAAKRKAFEQGKAIAISNAVMQTAQAVIAAFSSAAAVPIAGIALGPIMAGVAGAMGAAQIAVIASQKFTAARGGVVPGQPSKMDSVNALLAPGEMVINSESSAKYPELLSAINQAGGGISLAPEPVGNSSSNVQYIYKNNEQQQTIKAFVVESEMTDAQRNVNRMRDSASWG